MHLSLMSKVLPNMSKPLPRSTLGIKFEVQHALGRMESLLRSFEVISLPRSSVQLLRNLIAVVLGDVHHTLARDSEEPALKRTAPGSPVQQPSPGVRVIFIPFRY